MGFLVIYLKVNLKNGLKELLLRSYQMLMKKKDRIGLRTDSMVELVKNSQNELS